jgi:hypothetical protein
LEIGRARTWREFKFWSFRFIVLRFRITNIFRIVSGVLPHHCVHIIALLESVSLCLNPIGEALSEQSGKLITRFGGKTPTTNV